MFTWPEFLLKCVQVVLLNLVLSGDNVGIIALAVRGLSPRAARRANLLGGCAAMALRVVFVAALGAILSLRFLHLHLFGGLLLLLITLRMVRAAPGKQGARRPNAGFSGAVLAIVAADVSMSFDNALAIASVVMAGGGAMDGQKLLLVGIGLAVCVPVIFFGSGFVAGVMRRHPMLVPACAGLLVYTAVRMLFEDEWLACSPASPVIARVCALVCAVLIVLYGALGMKTRRAL